MDRELVLVVLALVTALPAAHLLAWRRGALPLPESGRVLERRSWYRLWLPLAPTVFCLFGLAGWALLEPDNAESVPAPLMVAAVACALILLRALARFVRALRSPPPDVPAATVGLFRPHAVLSQGLVMQLDEVALAAAREHELAHVRHRDPLRIWLAQLATDLQWPWPAAKQRFRDWLRSLELARDEEARLAGVRGEDLAAAILAAVRLRPSRSSFAPSLIDDESALEERIHRLLEPIQRTGGARPLLLPAIGVAASAAIALGATVGEAAVRVLLRAQ